MSACYQLDRHAIAAEIEAGASIHSRGKYRGSLPSEYFIYRLAATFPDFAQRIAPFQTGRRPQWGEDRQPEVLELVRCGVSINARPRAEGMPREKVLTRWRKDPAFAVELAAAKREGVRRRANRSKLSRAPPNAAWTYAQRAVPRTMDSDIRDDLVSELSLLILSGEVALTDDLGAAWKRCRTRLNRDKWKEVSLDAPLNGFEGASRVDMLADDTPHF